MVIDAGWDLDVIFRIDGVEKLGDCCVFVFGMQGSWYIFGFEIVRQAYSGFKDVT